MDSESPLPAKRLRVHANFQLTECVREFKLPRQFPSMVPTTTTTTTTATAKLASETENNKRMIRLNNEKAIELKAGNKKMRKIKLKGKDGRDLGEVNVQDLPQNIQGKTICLAKNAIKMRPEILPVTDKSKGITIGVLTPLNVVNSDRSVVYPAEKIPSLTCVPTKIDQFTTTKMEKASNKTTNNERHRPQVLVFQSGKNWHMVKVASSPPPPPPPPPTMLVQAGQSNKTVLVGKLPANEISSSQVVNKASSMIVKRWSKEGTTGEKTKFKYPASSVESEKPKIEVSRIFGKPPVENSLPLKSFIRQDVMVVLPSDSPVSSLDGEKRAIASSGTWRRTRLEANIDDNSRLSILEKALSTVSDDELRAKALKALAECGIGLERLVPVRPASQQKPVKDSDTQTDVFGLWHSEEFIYVSENSLGIGRKRPIAETITTNRHNVAHIVGNAHSQDFTLNNHAENYCTINNSILSDYVAELVRGNEASIQVENMLTKSRVSPVLADIVEQLEQDFHSYNVYDEDGLLNIHRSVLGNEPRALLRHLKVFKAFGESVDLPTEQGVTSLELAVRYQVSAKIVKYLLESGAEPTSDQSAHDSALIIASKKSLPILSDLISRVRARKSLDYYDGTGFTALHYCAQNGNEAGVKALIQARADLDVRDRRSGRTALFHAVENQHMNIAQLLLDSGAQPNISNYSGQTVVNLIDDSKHYTLAETLNRLAN